MGRLNSVVFTIGVIFLAIALVEFSTPPEFILGYLYVGPILLSNWLLNSRVTAIVTALSVVLTLANLVIPDLQPPSAISVVDRLITVAALLTASYLGARFRAVQEESARQRARLQAQEELDRVREDFIATLTHDLKTPLIGAQQTLAFLGQGHFGPINDQQQEVVGMLQKSATQQLTMVEMLLSIYRNDARGLVLERHFIDLDDLVAEQVTLLQDLALAREIALEYAGLEGARLAADGLQLARVVTNLVSNAIHHTPRGGRVAVRLEAEPGHYRLLVEDTGSGIPEVDLGRIFERFYRSGLRHASGTGLGLYLARQIVEAHGGQIWVRNRLEGGCIFGVDLPTGAATPPVPTALQER